MSDSQGNSNGIEKYIAIAALATGLAALFFSWQANQIAREANNLAEQQLSPQVVTVSVEAVGRVSEYDAFTFGGTNLESYHGQDCEHVIRLTNLGGAGTAIVGHRTKLYYGDREVEYSSETDSRSALPPRKLSENIPNVQTMIIPASEQGNWDPGETFFDSSLTLQLPMPIEAFQTVDVVSQVGLYSNDLVSVRDPRIHLNGDQDFDVAEYSPLEVQHFFLLASGDEVSMPRTTCLLLLEYEAP